VGGSNNSGSQNANEAFSVGLACDIQMTGSAYLTGEVVTARVFRFANGNAMTVPIELKIWLGLPGIAPVSFVNAGGTGSLSLPPGFNQDLGPLPLFTVTPGSPRGAYELGCRILDPVTGRLLAEDLNPFTIN
jgi:hypothetical protein